MKVLWIRRQSNEGVDLLGDFVGRVDGEEVRAIVDEREFCAGNGVAQACGLVEGDVGIARARDVVSVQLSIIYLSFREC